MFEAIQKFSRMVRSILFGVFCGGPILFIIGIIFIVSGSKDTRGDLIASYNSVAQSWTSNWQSEFTGSTFSVQSSSDPPTVLPIENTPASSLTTVRDSDTSGVAIYAPYVAVMDNGITRDLDKTYSFIALDANGVPSTFTFAVDPTSTRKYSQASMGCRTSTQCNAYSTASQSYTDCIKKPTCSSTCSTLGGTLDASNTCTVTLVLDSICLRVARDTSGRWDVDKTNVISPNRGCYSENQFAPGTYRSTSGSSSTLTKFELRSVHDPLIFLSWKTSGSYGFGIKQATKLATGVTLLVLGIVVTFTVCTGVWCCIRRIGAIATAPKQQAGTAVIVVPVQQPQQIPQGVPYMPMGGYAQPPQQGNMYMPPPGNGPYPPPQQQFNKQQQQGQMPYQYIAASAPYDQQQPQRPPLATQYGPQQPPPNGPQQPFAPPQSYGQPPLPYNPTQSPPNDGPHFSPPFRPQPQASGSQFQPQPQQQQESQYSKDQPYNPTPQAYPAAPPSYSVSASPAPPNLAPNSPLQQQQPYPQPYNPNPYNP